MDKKIGAAGKQKERKEEEIKVRKTPELDLNNSSFESA